jgi:hypothetical protein
VSKINFFGKKNSISTVIAAVIIVVLVIVAGVGFGLYYMQVTSAKPVSTSNYDTVTSLAFQHWTAIGDANLTATMSQYSSSASLWWYVHGSALNTTTVAYTGSSISSTWTKFFSAAGPTYWTVYNYKVSFPSSTEAVVTATLYYVLGKGTSVHTLYLPYELVYSNQNGKWVLTADWWGLPGSPGMVYSGVVMPSSTSSSTTSSSSSSSSSSGYSNSY